jgi:putative lipoic acid-binding regulatory protein
VNRDQARDLIESVHQFPGIYVIKAIGHAVDDFVPRVLTAARESLGRHDDVQHTVRVTPQGNHVSVTLEVTVVTAEEVIRLYQAIQNVSGLRFLL